MSLLNCVPYVLTRQRALRAYVASYLACLRAKVPTGLACLWAHMPTFFACSCADVPTCLAYLGTNVATCLMCSHTESIYSFFFFEVKLFYWNENSLWNKVETTRITRNTLGLELSRAFRQKGSSRITISQIHLSFPLV